MAYKCIECGHIFECGEESTWQESRGEFWGSDCSEAMSGCPMCKGQYEETVPCEICGSEQFEKDLHGGVCEHCINSYKNDIKVCYNIGNSYKEKIELNCFLASIFSKDEIESMLWDEVQKRKNINCLEFINSDREWFGERLAEEVKK